MVFALSGNDDDDRAFQVTLSFLNECVLDDEEEDAEALKRTILLMQREDEEIPSPSSYNPVASVPIGFETSRMAPCTYELTSARSATTCEVASTHQEKKRRRRRRETHERKRLWQTTGICHDANGKDSRLELAYLQQIVEKLQLELQVLQSRSSRQEAARFQRLGPADAIETMQDMPRVWGDISGRQHRRLKESERENARLRLAVHQQQEAAHWMQNLVQKRASHLMSDCSSFMEFDATRECFVRMLSSQCGDAGDFPLLFRHLETARQEVDAVFTSNGLTNMVLTPSDVHLRDGVNGKYLEAFSNKVLPFELRAVAEATWDHFKGGEKHLGNGNIYEKTVKSHEDPYTIMEEFTKEMHSKNARADIKAQQLVRRYMEPGRDIIIWVSVAKPAKIKHKMLRGLTYHLRGYAMTKRSPVSTPEHEISQLQCVSLISLEPEAEALHGVDTLKRCKLIRTVLRTPSWTSN
uniref:M96 mating-specific protein family n=1 Tax=Hyaloperonospora arabidopsidis (strain Emoy2) TaxID=559515 RepID=M4B1E8_HYAAE